jgi:pyruvate formate lyase activating enzyme
MRMRESLLYDKLPGGKVKCNVCAVRCIIPEGDRGACRTAPERSGNPLHPALRADELGLHRPRSRRSRSTTSTRLADPVDGHPRLQLPLPGLPELGDLPRLARPARREHAGARSRRERRDGEGAGCQGIGWTYNDPTIWLEHTLEAMIEAKKLGLYSAFMTNGLRHRGADGDDRPVPHRVAGRHQGLLRESYKKVTGLARWDAVLEMTKLAITSTRCTSSA